jgi:hypothetical protein
MSKDSDTGSRTKNFLDYSRSLVSLTYTIGYWPNYRNRSFIHDNILELGSERKASVAFMCFPYKRYIARQCAQCTQYIRRIVVNKTSGSVSESLNIRNPSLS